MVKKIFLAFSLSFVVIFYLVYEVFFDKNDIKTPIEIEIKKGSSKIEIAKLLKDKNVIDNWQIFLLYSLIKGDLKAGFYEFQGNLSINDVFNIIHLGKEKLIKVTIIPGDNLFIIAEKLEENNLIKKDEFLKYVFNKENLKKWNLEGTSFEGYFPPETYGFKKNENIDEIINKFLEVFKKRYMPYKEKIENKDYSEFGIKKLSFYQAMIIASMIEKETAIEEEKPIIAGVILNRLKLNMPLQIDPTVIYALYMEDRWSGNLTKKDLHVKSDFNTYVKNGVPPTPICNFSISSLEAVLNPKKTDYLYYVATKEKYHLFSNDYKTHLENIQKIYRSK